jgi:pantoate--beta-alanine ligase
VLEDGEASGAAAGAAMRAVVATEPLVQLDYAVAVDADTLEEVATPTGRDRGSLRLLIAAQVGPVRLIDNCAALANADDVRAVPAATEKVRQLERIG